jgi:hypothetical protein
MPRNKDLKRLVRARMSKTGEAYTAARAQIVRKASPRSNRAPATSVPLNCAELAGMSDAVIREKTGATWEEWARRLDNEGAAAMSHRDIARLVQRTYDVPDWWTQTVTVGYERIKGLRERGQRRDGSYEANKSRTYNVPISRLFDAWADATSRQRWLDEPGVRVRTATARKALRLVWPDGSIVVIGFLAKDKAKSSVAVQHTKLPDRETADRFKRYWSERLDALGEKGLTVR